MAIFLILVGGTGYPADPKLPLIGGKPALAVVNDEPLTLEEFHRELASLHEGMTDNTARSRSNPSDLLERLINMKLILQEARHIGLDELPEVKDAVKAFEDDSLRSMLYGYHVRNIKEPDKKEVERRYKEAVKEVKVASVLVEKEDVAKRLAEEMGSGGDFDEAAKKALASGEGKSYFEAQYIRYESLLPEIAAALSSMKKGEVSPPIKMGNRFSIVRLEDIRYPEDPAAREKAWKDALQAKRVNSLKVYTEGLRKKYVKVHQKLVDSLDYEAAEPGFEKLLADKRVVADVKGEKPVTVMDLSTTLKRKFFHGAELAAQEGKLNKRKNQVMEEILSKRVTLKEAKQKKFDKMEHHKRRVEEYRNAVLFGTFFQKVVAPDIKAEESELTAYLQEHIDEYTTPEMMRIEGLAFTGRQDAEDAIEKLRKGADFQWTRAYAEGQVDASKGKNLPIFAGNLVETSELPEGVQKAVSGAREGDYRIYAEAGGPYYALQILEVIPPKPQPLEAVRDAIEKNVLLEKRQGAMRDWAQKLRNASVVKIFATGEKLDRIVRPRSR